jgi:porin
MANGRYLQTVYMSNPNTAPNETLLAVEYGRAYESKTTGLRKYAIGFWYYTNSKTTDIASNAIAATNNQGFYGLVEAALSRETGSETQGLNGYLRYGVADSRLNQFASYIGAGFVYTGLFGGREDDQAGIGLAIARNGGTYKAATAGATDSETNIELSYRFQIKPWLAIQPDLQYVINPGAGNSNANATYFAIRTDITL